MYFCVRLPLSHLILLVDLFGTVRVGLAEMVPEGGPVFGHVFTAWTLQDLAVSVVHVLIDAWREVRGVLTQVA
jgi:hypothetical protein